MGVEGEAELFTMSAHLVVARGHMLRAGRPLLIVSVRASRLGAEESSHLLTVQTGEPDGMSLLVRDTTVPSERVTSIWRVLCDAGLPALVPDVEGVPDTSDEWTSIALSVAMNGRRRDVHLTMGESGYRGNDAGRVALVLATFFDLAGVTAEQLAPTLGRVRGGARP